MTHRGMYRKWNVTQSCCQEQRASRRCCVARRHQGNGGARSAVTHSSAVYWSTQGLRMDHTPSSWPPPNLAVSFVFVGTVTTVHIFGFNESFPSARPAGRLDGADSAVSQIMGTEYYTHTYTYTEKETLCSYWRRCHSPTLQGQLNFPLPQPGILDWSWKAVDVDTSPRWKSIHATVWPIRFLARWQPNNQIIGVQRLNAAPCSWVKKWHNKTKT